MIQVSRLMLLSGANPNTRTAFLHCAPLLCVAAHEGFSDFVSLLLEFVANVDAVSDTGMSALCYAAAAGHIDVIRLLCLKHARVSFFVFYIMFVFVIKTKFNIINVSVTMVTLVNVTSRSYTCCV
jgi:ankyrin repeat protein